MSNIKYYHVIIHPFGPYFFGQEASRIFGNKQPYYRRSRSLPSPTTILGMIRRVLCIQNGIVKWQDRAIPREKISEAETLIGKSSFDPENASYGRIKYISPLSLVWEGNAYFPASHIRNSDQRDWFRFEDEADVEEIDVMGDSGIRTLPIVRNFNAKDSFKEAWYCMDSKKVIGSEIVIKRKIITHSSKSRIGQSERTSFFKDEIVQYLPGVNIQFIVGLDHAGPLIFKSGPAILGADQRLCHLDVSAPSAQCPGPKFEDLADISGPALIISDSFPAEDYQENIRMAFCTGHRMTYLQTSVTTATYASASRDEHSSSQPVFSRPVHVLNAGGVIWPAKNKTFADVISCIQARIVGFNHVIPL